MSSKNKSPKVAAYLKVADKCSADYTFCCFEAQSNGVPSPEAGFQQPNPETSVIFEAFDANFQLNMGQQDLIYLLEYLQTMSIELPQPINFTKL